MAPCLQGQHPPSAQVRVTWRFDAPDSTAMSTPRRSSSLAASTQLRCLHDDFDAALPADLGRIAALTRRYLDLPLGATDASLIAIAERLGIDTIATLDRRHFTV